MQKNTMKNSNESFSNIPDVLIAKWQDIADLLAKIIEIPASLIMITDQDDMEVFVSSNSKNNPYNVGDKEKWDGLYCETVIKNQQELLVPNALTDKNWDKNPDIKQGMISYLGYPINFPNKTPFGTICVLDNKENKYLDLAKKLIQHFRDIIERDLEQMLKIDSAKKELKNLSIAIEQSANTIVITDLEGIIEYTNSKFNKETGYTAKETLGKNIRILNSGKQPKEYYIELWQTITKGKVWKGEFHNKRKNGESFWENVTISPIKNEQGHIINFLAIKEDITAQKTAEQALIIAKEKAEESDRLKSAFLANISHEIRTPMNGILGFASLLKRPHLTGEKQQEFIEVIEQSGTRMLNLINDIIDISKIEAEQVEVNIKELDINAQCENIYSFFKPETDSKGLQFLHKKYLHQEKTIIKTDKDKLLAILNKLVKNAIKYSKQGSIEFGCTRKGEHLEFFVKDTGIGIPQKRQKAIFDRFVQADISDRDALEGAGLGLSISKAYAEMLGGALWVESIEGKGSTFYFTILHNTYSKEKAPMV